MDEPQNRNETRSTQHIQQFTDKGNAHYTLNQQQTSQIAQTIIFEISQQYSAFPDFFERKSEFLMVLRRNPRQTQKLTRKVAARHVPLDKPFFRTFSGNDCTLASTCLRFEIQRH
jgi:hypothetical protein